MTATYAMANTASASPAAPVHGQPFVVIASLANTGTSVDVTIDAVSVHKISGPSCTIGNPVQGTTMAGANEPSTYGTTSIANTSGTGTFYVPMLANAAGTLVLSVIAHGTRADDGTRIQVVASNLSLTIS